MDIRLHCRELGLEAVPTVGITCAHASAACDPCRAVAATTNAAARSAAAVLRRAASVVAAVAGASATPNIIRAITAAALTVCVTAAVPSGRGGWRRVGHAAAASAAGSPIGTALGGCCWTMHMA